MSAVDIINIFYGGIYSIYITNIMLCLYSWFHVYSMHTFICYNIVFYFYSSSLLNLNVPIHHNKFIYLYIRYPCYLKLGPYTCCVGGEDALCEVLVEGFDK